MKEILEMQQHFQFGKEILDPKANRKYTNKFIPNCMSADNSNSQSKEVSRCDVDKQNSLSVSF